VWLVVFALHLSRAGHRQLWTGSWPSGVGKAILPFRLSSGYLTVYTQISQLRRSPLLLQKFVGHNIVCTCVQVKVTVSLVFEPCHLQCHAICMLKSQTCSAKLCTFSHKPVLVADYPLSHAVVTLLFKHTAAASG
jgi:hypothetical protein